MEQLRPIYWAEGLFLNPQHFQQQDRYHETRLWRYLQLLHPYCWGVQALEIDVTALQNFLFDIKSCEFLTCDGTLIRFQNSIQEQTSWSNARIERCSFKKAFEMYFESPSHHDPFGIYLGFKRLQPGVCNIAYEDQTGSRVGKDIQRFKIKELPTPDLFAENADGCDLQYLMHEVQVLFEGDAAVRNKDYELLKIAELVRVSEGEGVALSKRYVPPALSIHASDILEDMLKAIRNALTAKGRSLAERARTHGRRAQDAEFLLVMQTVNRYIPVFDIMLATKETHPYTYYMLLRQLVAELSTFSETIPALGGELPPYRHDELWKCFDVVTRVAHELIRGLFEGGNESFRALKFRRDGDRKYYTAELDKAFLEANNRYYLAVKGELGLAALERSLMVTGRICAREDEEELQPNSLPGLSLYHQDLPPNGLSLRPGFRCFEIMQQSEDDRHLWRGIEQHQNIAVFCDLPSEKTEMQLWGVHDN